MLGYCWLFSLFLSRSGRYFTHVQGEVDSAPTYLTTIFPLTLAILEGMFDKHHSSQTPHLAVLLKCDKIRLNADVCVLKMNSHLLGSPDRRSRGRCSQLAERRHME